MESLGGSGNQNRFTMTDVISQQTTIFQIQSLAVLGVGEGVISQANDE
jgi:hypothetical protein